jgi:hypothetical protein
MSKVLSTKERLQKLKNDYDKDRFRYQDTNSIPNFKEIIDSKTGKHYDVKKINEVLEILNKMHREAMMYPMFVEWLLENRNMYKGVSKRFEAEIEYENKYVLKIDNIVHNKKEAHKIFEVLKNDLKDSGEF